MALAKFYTGTSADLQEKQQEDGGVYFTTDTNEIVVDIPGGNRTSFGKKENFQKITNEKVDQIFQKYFQNDNLSS